MDTNSIAVLIQALASKPATPSNDFWMAIAPSVILLIGAVVLWIKSQTITNQLAEAKTERAITAEKADVAHTKADATSKVVDTVAKEVNSKADAALDKTATQEAQYLDLTKRFETLQEKNRTLELKIAEMSVTPETVNKIVAAATAMRK